MYRVAIDTGGTFTDVLCFDRSGKRYQMSKALSTPPDFTEGVMNCLEKAAAVQGADLRGFLEQVEVVVHGTTMATNAILTSSGARTGLITTKGFRDLLELRRGIRRVQSESELYNLKQPFPLPICPRHLREEVEERVLPTGKVLTPLNEGDVRAAVRRLKKKGVEAIAVCFLFSFLHPDHERRTAEIIAEEYPEAFVSLAVDVLPRVREFERTSTTALNAYVGPLISAYVQRVSASLREAGFKGDFLIMQSNGGVMSAEMAGPFAVNTVYSGPVAGLAAGALYGGIHGCKDIISIDIGGTSFDAGSVMDGIVPTTGERWIRHHIVGVETADIHSIGAGGGSIACIDTTGILQVGPQSAGAYPGPVCLRRGGERPTLTDAAVVLGYISPDNFLGGEIEVDVDAAAAAIDREIGGPLGLDAASAAHAIWAVAITTMVGAINVVSIQKGYDPRDLALVAGGGAGPLHAAWLARECGIPHIIIPQVAPAYSALGLLLSNFKHNYVRTRHSLANAVDLTAVNAMYEGMEREATALLRREGLADEFVVLRRSAEMRYLRQLHEIDVEVPGGTLTADSLAVIVENFHQRHETLYGFASRGVPTEILSYKLTAEGRTPKPELKQIAAGGADPRGALKGERNVFFGESGGYVKTPVYHGARMRSGNVITGPAVVDETATTLVIPPGFAFRVDQFGNYLGEYA